VRPQKFSEELEECLDEVSLSVDHQRFAGPQFKKDGLNIEKQKVFLAKNNLNMEINQVFSIVAQIFIYCGAAMFIACFCMGALLMWQMFSLSMYTYKMLYKWNRFKKIPIEGRAEAIKSGKFPDDTENIK
jgi:hypothetical protein